MRIHRMQKRLTHETVRSARGIELRLTAITTGHVVACVARIGRIGDAELGVIEDVEGLSAELEVATLTKGLEVLQQRHVEVGA